MTPKEHDRSQHRTSQSENKKGTACEGKQFPETYKHASFAEIERSIFHLLSLHLCLFQMLCILLHFFLLISQEMQHSLQALACFAGFGMV